MKINLVVSIIMFLVVVSLAQTVQNTASQNDDRPIVSLMVWDEKAKEGSDSGEFRIYQTGKTIPDLTVYYAVRGTA